MRITSLFAETRDVFFDADDRALSASGFELIERSQKGSLGESQIKAFLLKGLMLHYATNVFTMPVKFVVSFDSEMVVNSFHLQSDAGVRDDRYEPYLLCDEEFVSNQWVSAGDVPFKTPLVAELFRLFMTTEWYREILGNYGTTFEEIDRSLGTKGSGAPFLPSLPMSPQMKVIIRDIVRYDNPQKDLARNFCKAKALELIHLQLEQVLARRERKGGKVLNASDVERIHEARRILKVNFRKPPTIKELSAMLATNENKLKTGFTSLFESTMYQYVIQLRVEHAIEMMRDGRMSVNEIADAVGYASLGHFTRAFKKVKGVAPSVFRKSILP